MARRRRRPRSPRDGRFIETIGRYNAQTDPSTIVLDEERVRYWLERGAQPSEHRPQAAEDPGHQLAAEALPCRTSSSTSRARSSTSPSSVKVEEFEEDDGTLVLELSVGEDDYGQVIGRGGRTAQALRTVVKAAAVQDNRRVLVDIVE